MSELLLELFSEEIPARMQAGAAAHMQEFVGKKLQEAGLAAKGIRTYVTPRRLALVIEGLPKELAAKNEEYRGPKLGAVEASIQGFLTSKNAQKEQLTEKDGYYFLSAIIPAKPTANLLSDILNDLVTTFPWPKSMRWGSGQERWVRPLKSILCVFDGQVLPLGFGAVKAGKEVRGHRFLSPAANEVKDFVGYAAALEKAHVVLDAAKRKEMIRSRVEALAAEVGGVAVMPESLLEEVTGLVEWPVLLRGEFDAGFLDLPPEVLSTCMKEHQKYFAVLDKKDSSKALPYFIFAANMVASDGGKAIIEGNQRVLRARLSDARFFWDLDRKVPLEEMAKKLKDITFHAKLGTIADKVERVAALAEALAENIPGCDKAKAREAAMLAKADLVSGMVGEFPELQGIMGRYYAQAAGKGKEIAEAIREHYAPQGPSDACPKQPVSVTVALADKLDTLVGMFAHGEKPTGSKDPFALRRAALGVLRIVVENTLRLPLKQAIATAFTTYKANPKEEAALLEFFADRLKVMMKEQGFRHDVIAASFQGGQEDDMVRLMRRAGALRDFLSAEDGVNLLAGYRRAANILKAEEKKDGTPYAGKVLDALLKESQEQALYLALETVRKAVEPLNKKEDFAGIMQALAGLRAPVDAFFDKVMVNVPEADVRTNRLNLLAAIRAQMGAVADFSVIEG